MCFMYPSCSESLFFDALLFRFNFYNYFGVGGHKKNHSGRDDMSLNQKKYFNFNITAMNVCSVQGLVLVLRTRLNLTSSSNHSRMTVETPSHDFRFPLDGNGGSWDRRTSREASVVLSDTVHAPKLEVRLSRPRSVPSYRITTSRRQMPEICRCCHCQSVSASFNTCLGRSANGRNT